MSKNKYCPDYRTLYPHIELTKEVSVVLKKSDRKMKYAEYDLKAESFVVDHETEIAYFIPSREDSLERLYERVYDFTVPPLHLDNYIFFASGNVTFHASL